MTDTGSLLGSFNVNEDHNVISDSFKEDALVVSKIPSEGHSRAWPGSPVGKVPA